MKTIREVINSYNRLPYVVIRKKYLIPTFRFQNLSLEQFNIKKSSGIINWQFPFFENPEIRKSYVKFIASNLPQDDSYEAYRKAYDLAFQQYKLKYIRPAQRLNMRPYSMYFKLNYSAVASRMNKFSRSESFLLTFKQYYSLPENEKEFYKEATQVWLSRKLESANQFRHAHEVPPIGTLTFNACYTQKYMPQAKQWKFTKEFFQRVKQLSFEERQEILAIVQEQNTKRKHVLNEFLNRYKITLPELKNIKKISLLYEDILRYQKVLKAKNEKAEDGDPLGSTQLQHS